MTPPIPTGEPQQITAGDSYQWYRPVVDYPAADGWTLKYQFRGPGTIAVQTASVDTSGVYLVTLAASATATIIAGVYRLFGWVENAGATERHTVFNGYVTIRPNVATTPYTDLLTPAERELAAIEAAITAQVDGGGIYSYTIDGTQVIRGEVKALYRQRGIARFAVWRERNPGKFAPSVAVRFGAVGVNVAAGGDSGSPWTSQT